MIKKQRRKLRVVFAASECVPFVKTGGLADVAGALPRALKRVGAKVSVILPKYQDIPEEFRKNMTPVEVLYVPLSWRFMYCGIEHLVYEGIDYYFIDNEQYFGRNGLYGWADDPERFAFFSKAICEAILRVPELACDILHTNDWQTALCPVFMREFYNDSEICQQVKHVFTVHNVKFQGQVSDTYLGDLLGLYSIEPAHRQLRSDERSINYLKGALSYADIITTVSPTYANELQMPYYGEGLDWLFRERQHQLRGILNGIDQKIWNPASDELIPALYSAQALEGKALCKQSIQQELDLEVNPQRPLVIMIGRLTDQKGIGLVRYAMDRMMSSGMQFALLGTGDYEHEEAFKYFASRYPGSCSCQIRFDNSLSHRMYAGGDFLLMPSEFEPCGLSQMIAMRYGTLPIVRETGGLRDTVQPYNQFTGEGSGFSFAHMNADEMCNVVLGACSLYWDNPQAFAQLQQQAMAKDVSWYGAANDYLDCYHELHPEVIRYNKRRDR